MAFNRMIPQTRLIVIKAIIQISMTLIILFINLIFFEGISKMIIIGKIKITTVNVHRKLIHRNPGKNQDIFGNMGKRILWCIANPQKYPDGINHNQTNNVKTVADGLEFCLRNFSGIK